MRRNHINYFRALFKTCELQAGESTIRGLRFLEVRPPLGQIASYLPCATIDSVETTESMIRDRRQRYRHLPSLEKSDHARTERMLLRLSTEEFLYRIQVFLGKDHLPAILLSDDDRRGLRDQIVSIVSDNDTFAGDLGTPAAITFTNAHLDTSLSEEGVYALNIEFKIYDGLYRVASKDRPRARLNFLPTELAHDDD